MKTLRKNFSLTKRGRLLAALTFLWPASLLAVSPELMNYQGRLADTSNNPRNGTFTFVFSIWDQDTPGGNQLWSETRPLTIENGVFEVQLGSVTSFPATLFDGTSRWLQISVDGETLTPRERLVAAPYALRVAANSIRDADINSAAEIAPSKITGGAFQNEDYTFPAPIRAAGGVKQDWDGAALRLFGGTGAKFGGYVELFGNDSLDVFNQPFNRGNVNLIADATNADSVQGGKITFLTYVPPAIPGAPDFLTRMIISREGNVGIGTVNPLDRLDVGDGAIKVVAATAEPLVTSPGLVSRSTTTFAFPSPLGGNVYLNESGLGFVTKSETRDIAYLSGRGGLSLFTGNLARVSIDESGLITLGNGGTPISKYLSVTGSLDFGVVTSNTTTDRTLSLTGAQVGDTVMVGAPATLPAGIMVMAFVSSANTVTVRCSNVTTTPPGIPVSGTFRVSLLQH